MTLLYRHKIYTILCLVIFSMVTCAHSGANFQSYGAGSPITYISGCYMDLNNDGNTDIAIYINTQDGCKLFALLRTKEGFTSYPVTEGSPMAVLACKWGMGEVRETNAGHERQRKIYKINGPYLDLFIPEGPEYFYFWDGKGFTEVWVAD